ncbi:hypothetical protein ACIP2X_04665 [Streptomyces sp. NPDC089424]|uniref:hypothetical protein n=1 Tax=Streptomyces sp. NPDC089424 TaxID=3365917 RepID=UPI00382158C1
MRTLSETTAETTELTSQYSAQVAGDLDRNVKEQDRLHGEIEALQGQLTALRHDHTVLVNIQQALGVPAPTVPAPPAPSTAEPAATVPAPRKTRKTKATSATAKQPKAKKPVASTRKRAERKSAAEPAAASPASPTLVELVRAHLGAQGEPRSAAEITTALAGEHPERTVKTTVVRTTLEGLVAKNQAQRTKQGSSVFYTTPESADPTTEAGELPEQGE